jgi:hypothetical protein
VNMLDRVMSVTRRGVLLWAIKQRWCWAFLVD